jgi:hypothetical protein
MLTEEDGERGRNLLTAGVLEVAKERLAQKTGVIERHRLLCNMLSSQPMCFNLWGPLRRDAGLATGLVSALLPGQVARVREVSLEYAPQPPVQYLNDSTAFDAFVDYDTTEGERAFLGIEVKLTEPFSQRRYRMDAPGHAYSTWTKRAASPWPPESWDSLDAMAHNQLWRDHMLVEALRGHWSGRYSRGTLVLVRHPGDTHCAEVVEGYRALLKPDDDSFLDLPLDRLAKTWSQIGMFGPQREWLCAFRLRYLELWASEEAWQHYCAARR